MNDIVKVEGQAILREGVSCNSMRLLLFHRSKICAAPTVKAVRGTATAQNVQSPNTVEVLDWSAV